MSVKSSKKHGALQQPERFINRELSWLAFNGRVLEEAENKRNPLLERVNFLSISAMNLDEFTMVRVAGLLDLIRLGSTHLSNDGMTAQAQVEQINARVNLVVSQQQKCWLKLSAELEQSGIRILKRESLSRNDIAWAKTYFSENIYPVLTPIAIDPAHPFPFLPNLGIAQLFLLKRGAKKTDQIAILPFPPKLPRFIVLPPKKKTARQRLVKLEDIIELNWEMLFPRSVKHASTLVRIVRDSDLDVEEEAEDLMRYFERAVKQRRRGRVIRIKVASPTAEPLLQFITSQMQIESKRCDLDAGHDRAFDAFGALRPAAPGSEVSFLQRAFPRAHHRLRRGLLRRHR